MRATIIFAIGWSGQSVLKTLYSPTHSIGEPFDGITLTHPAIFMVEYSLAQTLMQAGLQPDLVLAVSMGSFAAAAVAGFIDVKDAMIAVVQQAAIIEKSCERGGMIAIMADPALFAADYLRSRSELAAVNFPSHFVVSARSTDLCLIEAALGKNNFIFQRLPVCFAFHSQWVDDAKTSFLAFMRSIQCKPGRLPLVCCDQATTLRNLSGEHFWNAVRRPIRFSETIARLEEQGGRRYIDVGPAGTLATFLKYGMPAATRSTVHPILTPFGMDKKNLVALLALA